MTDWVNWTLARLGLILISLSSPSSTTLIVGPADRDESTVVTGDDTFIVRVEQCGCSIDVEQLSG